MTVDLRRLFFAAIPMLGFVGFVFIFAFGAPGLRASPLLRRAPQEPIAFDHSVHVQVAKVDCAFCHRTATVGAPAGYPEVQQCMFCHQAIAQSSRGAPGLGLNAEQAQAEIEKVRQAWQLQKPINWERVHRMPDHVRFVHQAHIQAGISCSTCHGDVGSVGQVTQVRALTMGDCLTCHRQNAAPTECAVCHK
jgi:hypothetical protein